MGRRIAESPIAPLVDFSAATNLGIAGRAFRLAPSLPERERLAAIVAAFGGRVVDGEAAVMLPHTAPAPRTVGERIDHARAHMPVSRASAAALGELVRGRRIAISLVAEPKTAVLALLLAEAGAEVTVFAFAIETDDEVAAELRARGVTVHASAAATPAEERANALALLDAAPELLVDDGAHVVRLAHAERPQVVAGLIGATEETTSGVTPLKAMAADGALRIPVIAANDAFTKTWFDNRHGTGETCVLAIVRALDDDLDGRRVVVIGFGPVGEGCAERLRALGAIVTVVDRDPRRALAAGFAGYRVAAVLDAVADADLIVSATGVRGTVDGAVLAASPDGVVVAVAGGAPGEVDIPADDFFVVQDGFDATPPATPSQTASRAPGPERRRTVRLLARGECVNIVAGEGNPIDVMDLSFAVQLASIRQLLTTRPGPGVHPLDPAADRAVAAAATGVEGTDAAAPAPAEWRWTRFDLGTAAPPPQPAIQVVSADLVVPMTTPPIRDGAVAIERGRILHVGTRAWVVEHLAGRPFTERRIDGALLPGLVNAHTHLQYTRMAEVGRGSYRGFDDWAAAFTAVYQRGQDWADAAAEGARRSLAAGVTTIADVVTDRQAASALADAGLHGIAYWEVMDWSNAEWRAGGRDRVIAELESIPTTPGSGLSPHAPYSLDVEPLLDIPDIVRAHGGRLHIHLGEARFEGAEDWPHLPDWHSVGVESFRALRAAGYGASATEFVDRLGVLGPDCHVAHGVYMTADDRALLRARGSSVALCPRSNDVIGLDAPPVAAYLREGSPIAVGTDSLSSSPSLDPMADVAALVRIAREQGYTGRDLHERLLSAATLGGAVAMGLDTGPDRLGYLAVGAVADLVGFPMAVGSEADALAELAEAAPASRITVVAGVAR